MAQAIKIKWWDRERMDLPDVIQDQAFNEQDFKLQNRFLFGGSSMSYVVSGFVTSQDVGNAVKVHLANSTMFQLTTGTDLKGILFVGDAGLSDITGIQLSAGLTNFIHIKLDRVTTSPALRTFWNKTLNAGFGGEVQNTVDTAEIKQASVVITVNTPSVDPNLMLIASVITDGGGVITSLKDERNSFYRLGKGPATAGGANYNYTLTTSTEPNPDILIDPNAFIGGDKQISDLKSWMDFVMSQLKLMKFGTGTTQKWYEAPVFSLADVGDSFQMNAGGVYNWNLGTNTLSFSQTIQFLIPGTAFVNTITGPGTMVLPVNDDIVYVDIDVTGNTVLTPHVILASAYVPQPNRLIIVRRLSNIVYVGNAATLKLQDGESGELVMPLTSQNLAYQGAPSAVTSSPTYSSNHVVANGDSLTTAIGKLDAQSQNFSALTQGSVLFMGAAGVVSQDNANFFFDDTNNRLGIGTNAPAKKLHVKSASTDLLRLETPSDGGKHMDVDYDDPNNQVAFSTDAVSGYSFDKKVQSTQFISTVGPGTPPAVVASSDKVVGLNSDLLDGISSKGFLILNGSYLSDSSGGIPLGLINDGFLSSVFNKSITITVPGTYIIGIDFTIFLGFSSAVSHESGTEFQLLANGFNLQDYTYQHFAHYAANADFFTSINQTMTGITTFVAAGAQTIHLLKANLSSVNVNARDITVGRIYAFRIEE